MDFGLKKSDLALIKGVFANKSFIHKAVIFGSRARNNHKKTSDIDIAVYGDDIDSTQLNLLRDELDQLNLIYKIDVIDYFNLTKEGMKTNIDTEGRQIYP